MKTDWSNLYKIKIRELKESQTKHLIVKTLIAQKLLIKHKRHRQWVRIYTEFNINERICDVYYENLKTKECYAFEIQENITKEWEKNTIEFYKNWEKFKMTTDLIIVDLKKLSDNIEELNKQINELIV